MKIFLVIFYVQKNKIKSETKKEMKKYENINQMG